MAPFAPTHASLARLADRIVAGEVVFLVGAGASRDSEGNTGEVLIARLLARFEAMSGYLREHASQPVRQRAQELYASLQQTFSVEPVYLKGKQVATLAWDYYLINDWMCGAFDELLNLVDELRTCNALQPARFVAHVKRRERELFQSWRRRSRETEPVPGPGELDLEGLLGLDPGPRTRGKALFLDTMGFTERAVMGGDPLNPDVTRVMSDECGGRPERHRLLDRHHVLARFAREGLCQTLITTNYDMLVESAYRLAGFDPLPARPHRSEALPPTSYEFFDRVASAGQFFQRGLDARAPRVVKIHGCADTYRRFRHPSTGSRTASWQAYLPTMVFTYREIQNWRQDAWSRDLLATLLRTRTVVFCGYSGVDPVLHDTFRTVYEDMAARGISIDASAAGAPGAEPEAPGGRAPAFFFGLQGRREFHGMQILRAASQAGGDTDGLRADHPNYIGFQRKVADGPFPTLDELMVWLYHLVLRRRQQQMLRSDLTRIATLLLEHAVPPAEVEAIQRRHLALCQAEIEQAMRWQEDRASRAAFNRSVGWTHRFHVGLLRELAIAEDALRNLGPGLRAKKLRWPWYYPCVDHPDWTAWTAVVELAVRRMIAQWRRDPHSWSQDCAWVQPSPTREPGVLFSQDADHPTPRLLTIMSAPGDEFSAPVVPGAFRARPLWKLQPASIPWL